MSAGSHKDLFLDQIQQVAEVAEILQGKIEKKPDLDSEKPLKYLGKILKSEKELRDFAVLNLLDEGFDLEDEEEAAACKELRHDVRNRLNHMYGPCQLLQRCVSSTELAADASTLRESIERCSHTIDEYGSMSRRVVQELDTNGVVEPRFRSDPLKSDPAHILVAEDEAENREFLVEVLTSLGHQVTIAETGPQALKYAQEKDVDLVLLDLGLPEMSGFQVLDELKTTGHLNHTPVIVVTGRRGLDDAVRCIENGADEYLTKPVQIELLRARVSSSVEKKRLREKEFDQFSPGLARELARHPNLREMKGKDADITVLFCDIRRFSAISEKLGAEKTVSWLRYVMDELSLCVIENEGVLVDYTGDELFAMWGAPTETNDHAERACKTAQQMFKRLPRIDRRWEKQIGEKTKIGIGINSGPALVGNVGTARKFKYGPLGNTVNLGSRVQGATKFLQTPLLITGETRKLLDKKWTSGKVRQLCRVRVVNIEEPVELCELSYTRRAAWKELCTNYEKALQKFTEQDFGGASKILGQILADHANDGPSLMLMSRVVDAMLATTGEFDDVWTLPGK